MGAEGILGRKRKEAPQHKKITAKNEDFESYIICIVESCNMYYVLQDSIYKVIDNWGIFTKVQKRTKWTRFEAQYLRNFY